MTKLALSESVYDELVKRGNLDVAIAEARKYGYTGIKKMKPFLKPKSMFNFKYSWDK